MMVLEVHAAVDLGRSLAQALRYVNAWKRRSVVVKYGGSVMASGEGEGTLIEDLVLLKGAGIDPVLVHGGGSEITRMLDRLGKESRFVNGLRVTDEETMEVVEMVLAGSANKAIVSQIATAGGQAVGISGQDGKIFQARKLEGPVDLGQVGEIEAVDTSLIQLLSGSGFIPVVASIGIGGDGTSYNLNADHAAGALAAAMGASKFILLTDVSGIYRDEERSPVSVLKADEAKRLIREGVVSRGMIPKVEACLAALAAGVPTAHIVSGTQPHALLVELFTEEGVGTMIVP
ncbi:MAG: acetylglutamate kinase [Armatimonadetes bacterium]|nr:acetylglutamate kinase [Armatimonadota bacterium]